MVVPSLFDAVIVYMVFTKGETTMEPEAATDPILLSMSIVLALLTFQLKAELFPDWMVTGFAEKETVGGWGFLKVIVVLEITDPPFPFAVKI